MLLLSREDDIRSLEGFLDMMKLYLPVDEYTRNNLARTDPRSLEMKLHDYAYSLVTQSLPALKERAFESLGS